MNRAATVCRRLFAVLLAVVMAAAALAVFPEGTAAETTSRKKADLVFVIDSTGSMGDEINNVKTRISSFARTLESWGLRMRIGIVEYRDITEDGMDSTVVHELNHSVWLSSTDQMVDMLGRISVAGGGDPPETVLDGLGFLIEGKSVPWSSDAYKFAVVLTDAGYKTDNRHGYTSLAQTAELLLEKGVNTSVITATDIFSSYRVLAETTGGILADINSDFDSVLEDLANSIMGLANRSKKAIYILPGFLGSELYDGPDGTNGGNIIWADIPAMQDGASREKFYQDEDSGGTLLHVDYERDDYGAFDHYKKLVQRMVSEFGKENGGEYDVRFFPYNWLEDLNDSELKLENDIQRNGYTDVVFITHSTGGLLASAYIAKSNANKLKVEKALLIAAPLFGTYSSLLPIERGDSRKTMNVLSLHFWMDALTDNAWVKGWARNSPTAYQLLPSKEYLSYYPVIYTGGLLDSDRTFYDIGSLYWLMNSSVSVNSKLTNGSGRSHNAFRTDTLHDDVVSQWSMASLMEVDTLLLGTFYGHSTPAMAVYSDVAFSSDKWLSDIYYNKYGDDTVQGISAAGIKRNGSLPLRYDFSYRSPHGDLVDDDSLLDRLCSEIRGGSVPANYFPDGDSIGMSDMLKIRFETSDDYAVTVYDASGEAVAHAEGDTVTGFDGDELILDTFGGEDAAYVSMYMPASGYRAEITHGGSAGDAIDLSYEVSTLAPDGWKDVSVANSVFETGENGAAAVFDCTSAAMTGDNITALVSGTVTRHAWDWSIPETIRLNKGDVAQTALEGSDAEAAAPDIVWHSSDESVAVVSESGVVTAKGYGKAVITADDGNRFASAEVTVVQNPTSISFENVDMVLGERTLIRPVFQPSTATETNVTYTADRGGVVEINEYGVMHAIGAGTVRITGAAPGGATAQFTVTVTDPTVYSVESVSLPETAELGIGQVINLTAVITPDNATDRSVSWYVEDESIVTIETEGENAAVTGVALGTTVITAVTSDGGYIAECTVTVGEDEVPATPEPSYTPLPTILPAQTPAPTPTPAPAQTPEPADGQNGPMRGGGSAAMIAVFVLLTLAVIGGAVTALLLVNKRDKRENGG